MRRLLWIALACLFSLALQAGIARLWPVPQTDLFIGTLIARKLARAAAIGAQPKLVILAGSNGLYSHSCRAMGPVLGLPCVNASVAVGVGLDYLFALWRPVLHPGDVVYMPMEPVQFTRGRAATRVGPETRLLPRQWRVLWQLPPDRQLAALFGIDLRGELHGLVGEPGLPARMRNVEETLARDFDPEGDRVGHRRELAAGAAGRLDALQAEEPPASAIADGYGAALIGGFVRWATGHGIRVVGGLSTGFADVPLPEAAEAAMRAAFTRNGGEFLALPNRSRYPRHDFFDTRYHLYEACQIRHSLAVARALAPMLGRAALPLSNPPPDWATAPCGG